jgi:hypothetical protein
MVVVSILAGAALVAGCNIVAPAVYLIHGPDKIKAQYELPKEKPAVVFIDDRANILPNRSVRQRIAHSAEKNLLEAKAVGGGDIVSSDAILAVSAQERFGKPTGIAEVGKAVGASTVVYATVDSFGLSSDGQEFAPFGTMRVKVIDVESRRRLWPTEDREWASVAFTSPSSGKPPPTRSGERSIAEYALADHVGQALARLFVEYTPEDVAQRVGE